MHRYWGSYGGGASASASASASGVTLLCAAPLLIEICHPYPPLKFCAPKKKKKKKKR